MSFAPDIAVGAEPLVDLLLGVDVGLSEDLIL